MNITIKYSYITRNIVKIEDVNIDLDKDEYLSSSVYSSVFGMIAFSCSKNKLVIETPHFSVVFYKEVFLDIGTFDYTLGMLHEIEWITGEFSPKQNKINYSSMKPMTEEKKISYAIGVKNEV